MSDAVASVAGRPISAAQLELRLAEVARGPRGRHISPAESAANGIRAWILRELVDEAILLEEARAAGIVGSRSWTMTGGDVALLVELVTAGIVVAEAEVRNYFERNPDLFRRPATRTVRLVTCSSEAAAASADLEAVAPLTMRRGELVGPVEDAIFRAGVGALVGPLETELGWHCARVEALTEESTVPFIEARPEIEAELLRAARLVAFDEWLARRRRTLARLRPGFEHPGQPGHGPSSHRH
jgi:[acyl-carrier-protein] S-malonyltransferase